VEAQSTVWTMFDNLTKSTKVSRVPFSRLQLYLAQARGWMADGRPVHSLHPRRAEFVSSIVMKLACCYVGCYSDICKTRATVNMQSLIIAFLVDSTFDLEDNPAVSSRLNRR
jgi:hypothetical protein